MEQVSQHDSKRQLGGDAKPFRIYTKSDVPLARRPRVVKRKQALPVLSTINQTAADDISRHPDV